MADVFVSYKKEQRERVVPIAQRLEALGVSVWFDAQLSAGRSFTEEIQEQLRICRAQVVLWSPSSVVSEWVRGEAEIGRQRNILVAAKIEPCELLPPFNMHHTEDLSTWAGDDSHSAWLSVLRRVGSLIDRPGLADLQSALANDDPIALKAWCIRYPSDPFAPEAARRANVPLESLSAPPAPAPAGVTPNAVRPPSLRELQSALEAADFRLRVCRDAAKRFGWANSDEEKRLELVAAALRQAVEAAEKESTKRPSEGDTNPANDHRKIQALVEPLSKISAWGQALAIVLAIAVSALMLLVINDYTRQPNADRADGASTETPLAEGPAAEGSALLAETIAALGGNVPSESASRIYYSRPFEAVGLDPRWAVQFRHSEIAAEYSDQGVLEATGAARQTRAQGFFVEFDGENHSFVLVVKYAHCSLPNGVNTDHQAFLFVDEVIHEGCAMAETGPWPLNDTGSDRWGLPPLTGVHESYAP